MARHGCSMCRGTGTVYQIVKGEQEMQPWTCSSCDGKGYHEREHWSSAHIKLPWNQKNEEED